MEGGEVGQHYETPYFHPRRRHPPSWNYPYENSVGSAYPLPHRCRTFPRLLAQMGYVGVVHKNTPSTILTSSVQSIDLPMDYTA